MASFPWTHDESENMAQQKQAYAASLKQQVEERQAAHARKKAAQLAADLADDARVTREQAFFAAQAAAEVQAQRDREALVARREEFAAKNYANLQTAPHELTRDEKIADYQRRRAASEQQSDLFGDDGCGAAPALQRNAKGLRRPLGPQERAQSEAHLAAAASAGPIRPDQQADLQAAAIKRRAQGSSSLW